ERNAGRGASASRKKINNAARNVFGASDRGRLRSRGPFLKATRLSLQKSWKLGYLEKWRSRPATTRDQGDWFISPRKPERGKGSKTRTRPEYGGKARDYEMDFPLTHADRAGAGLYVFTKRPRPGSAFIPLLQLGPTASLGTARITASPRREEKRLKCS